MMSHFAEIEPSFIFMILIWLFSSFFSKKGKKDAESKSKNRIMGTFEKLMNKLGESPNMDMNQAHPILSEYEEEVFEHEIIETHSNFNEPDGEEINYFKENLESESDPEKQIAHPEIKLFGTPLQKAMVLNEILAKPRALRPFDL